MLRIGIVGSDNSHALAFARISNVDRAFGDRARVVGIWGADRAHTEQVAADGEIPEIVDVPGGMLDEIDLAIVVDRHGGLHAEHALPYIERGLPVFIDKPFAIDLDECHQMIAAAERSGATISSFSALRLAPAVEEIAAQLADVGTIRAAQIAGPCDFDSPYGGPFFYATHVIEVALRLVGEDLSSVRAVRHAGNVTVTATWQNGASGSFALLNNAAYNFHVTLFGDQGMVARSVPGGAPVYTRALEAIIDMAGRRVAPLTAEQMLRPIRIVHAIVASLDANGAPVQIG